MKKRSTTVALGLAAVLMFSALSACSTKSASTADGDQSGIKTDFGVTATQIKLGVLSDLSGPFKELGEPAGVGHKLWVDDVNANGGICHRKVSLVSHDHGYKAETALLLYHDTEPNVLGFMEIFGSPVNAALDQELIKNKTTSVAISWSSFILKNPYVIIPGTTYDLEMINGLSYLLDNGKIHEGDTIGHIYLEGELGENGLRGSEYFAKEHNLKIKKVKVTTADTDLRNIVTGLRGAGVAGIALSTTPAQAASVASVNLQLGLNVPLMANNPSFAPSLLNAKSAEGMKHLYVATSSVPYSSKVAKAVEIAGEFAKSGSTVTPNLYVQGGYAMGLIWQQILEKACDNGDLTRDGVQKALKSLDNIETDSLIAPLDLSKLGTPATREVYLSQPDVAVPGGLKELGPLFVSEDAKAYVAPHQK